MLPVLVVMKRVFEAATVTKRKPEEILTQLIQMNTDANFEIGYCEQIDRIISGKISSNDIPDKQVRMGALRTK